MMTETLWLTKLLLAHLLTDFVLQPQSWVAHRKANKLGSSRLYLHGLITAVAAWILIGFAYWKVALIILVTHTAIDAWKAYRPEKLRYFIIDQLLHILVILACWYFSFFDWASLKQWWQLITTNYHVWIIITASLFLTTPTGILIGQFTGQWRDKIENAESLASAGKWIGIAERIIVFILVLNAQYSAIGLLVTAKGIIRFNEKDRQEIKTEYLVIGTLASIGMAIITGLIAKALLGV